VFFDSSTSERSYVRERPDLVVEQLASLGIAHFAKVAFGLVESL